MLDEEKQMNWQLYAAPLVGSILQEILYWYRVRERTESKKYQAMMRSRSYWVITALTVAFGSVATFLYFGDRLSVAEMLVAGAAFPGLLKKLVGAFADRSVTTLGNQRTRTSPSDYFVMA